ncbi:MarR family winged helix-turn-helix transcriptional regulator [Streptomyces sp. NPDC048248]|uniref:MarR family winged helix-turn-helix transcriptional regulator n=1 Tax=Streptomyces sp. NPDC048248 TaxID=3365523 RepID=UPI0037245381
MTTSSSTSAPFVPSHDDAGLIAQPIGFWANAAGQAVVQNIRAALGALGLTQPAWWVLHHLSERPMGWGRAELTEFLSYYPGPGDDLPGDIDGLVARGLVSQDEDGHLLRTESGAELYSRAAARQLELRRQVHEGIPDEEYARALKVLQRMIHNVKGDAWHH